MKYEQLKLSNQLCFPVYAASRLITREYQPHLDQLGITYPQYLVLLVLWETDGIPVTEVAAKLILNTNTLTPLLKRMETLGIITRTRSGKDERKVVITLTKKGAALKNKASRIPQKLLSGLQHSSLSVASLIELRDHLNDLVDFLKHKE
jgi:DNA-binding MarR family transcriptional regulator